MDKLKIITMTKLARYDKKFGEKDRKIHDYFQHDYIYKKNMWTRFFVIIGAVLILLNYLLYQFAINKIDIFDVDYKPMAIKMGVFLVALLILYTGIGTILATKEYLEVEKRLKRYFSLMSRLEKINQLIQGKNIKEEHSL